MCVFVTNISVFFAFVNVFDFVFVKVVKIGDRRRWIWRWG